MTEKTIFLEEAKKITGSNKPLTYAYSKDGIDFYVSDVFEDSDRNCPVSLLCVAKRNKDELILRLPYVTVDYNKGFTESESCMIQDFVWENQFERVCKFSEDYMEKYGRTISQDRKGLF